MEENFDKKLSGKKTNSKTAIIIKILTAACIVCAIALVGVIVMAFVNGGDDELVSSGDINSGEVITTDPLITTLPDIYNGVPSTSATESTTAATTTQAPKQSMAYATEEVNVRSEPSTDGDLVGVLAEGEGVIFISDNGDGWYRVMYDSEVCYINADYLTVEEVATTLPADTPQTGMKTIDLEHPRWYLVIVDRTRQMPEGFVPETDYVEDSEEELDARVVPYFDKMYNAALEDGIELVALSGYRSYETQQTNLDALTEEYMEEYEVDEEEAYEMAVQEILPAGCSEHNLGLAMDIGEIDEAFAESEEYAWLVENAHNYGFIERYTEENQDITGIIPEPWHWRFVAPTHAKKIKAAGITLEEYLQQNNVQY